MVFVSLFEGFGIPVLEAMRCGVPCILSDRTSLPEVGGDACLYANPEDANEIGEKMRLLYKDENLRNQLKVLCLEQAARFSWDKSANDFYQLINKVANTSHG
jgi:Glycosyltransferase